VRFLGFVTAPGTRVVGCDSEAGEFSSVILPGLGVVLLLVLMLREEIELGGKGGIVKANGVPPSPLSVLLPILPFPAPPALPPPLRFVPGVAVAGVPEKTLLRKGDDCAGLWNSERNDVEFLVGDSIGIRGIFSRVRGSRMVV
jgi:hypothetical protein